MIPGDVFVAYGSTIEAELSTVVKTDGFNNPVMAPGLVGGNTLSNAAYLFGQRELKRTLSPSDVMVIYPTERENVAQLAYYICSFRGPSVDFRQISNKFNQSHLENFLNSDVSPRGNIMNDHFIIPDMRILDYIKDMIKRSGFNPVIITENQLPVGWDPIQAEPQ